jgi:hypothetical protein
VLPRPSIIHYSISRAGIPLRIPRPGNGTNVAKQIIINPDVPEPSGIMIRISRKRLALALAVALALLPRTPVAGQDHVHEPAPTQDHQHDAAAARGGSAACAPISRDCPVESYLLGVLATHGVSAAMASLDSLAANDEEIRRDGHNYSHAIGLSAFTGEEEVGPVFSRCTPAFQSGCYHGVIQSFFTHHIQEHGGHIDVATINALCEDQRAERWLLFQCAHGMGHGTYMIANNQLPGALEACDLVADDWERESCYGGVFMENIVAATVPHHSVGRPDLEGAMDHSDHAMPATTLASAASAAPFPALKKDEPLYPCSVLEDRYLTSCYQMQTSAILWFNGSDVPAAARACAQAPVNFRVTCFQSLGRDVSSITLQDNARAIRLCAAAPEEYQPWCHLGYAKNLVDVTADPADGFAYCRMLPAGESKRVCNVAIGEQIWVLEEDLGRREQMCLAAEPEFRDACRVGAGIERPTADAGDTPAAGRERTLLSRSPSLKGSGDDA